MKKIIIFISLICNVAFSQISLDRTRVIFDARDTRSQTVVISNTNTASPYLAQTWLEDENGNKISSPLVALPILQRINPRQDKPVKITIAGSTSVLPQDRESLLFFNVLGVPPKDTTVANKVNVVLQSKLKLFYRPAGLPQYKADEWVKEMTVRGEGRGFILHNPTAYHIVIIAFSSVSNNTSVQKDIILKPYGTEKVDIQLRNSLRIHFVNDFGGGQSVDYTCSSGNCSIVEK